MKKLKLAALLFLLMILPAVGQERLGGSIGYDDFMLRQPKRQIDTLAFHKPTVQKGFFFWMSGRFGLAFRKANVTP